MSRVLAYVQSDVGFRLIVIMSCTDAELENRIGAHENLDRRTPSFFGFGALISGVHRTMDIRSTDSGIYRRDFHTAMLIFVSCTQPVRLQRNRRSGASSFSGIQQRSRTEERIYCCRSLTLPFATVIATAVT